MSKSKSSAASKKPKLEDDGKIRCAWADDSLVMCKYHDEEWGVAVHDDTKLFEMLVLEGAQAGLSWKTILNKIPAYREAFAGFDIPTVAKFDAAKQAELCNNAGIIRNKAKISSTVNNAKLILEIQQEFGSFDKYIWDFIPNRIPIQTNLAPNVACAGNTEVSTTMSKSLHSRGFRFVGPTICYAFMQAVGMTNDHGTHCFRFADLK